MDQASTLTTTDPTPSMRPNVSAILLRVQDGDRKGTERPLRSRVSSSRLLGVTADEPTMVGVEPLEPNSLMPVPLTHYAFVGPPSV